MRRCISDGHWKSALKKVHTAGSHTQGFFLILLNLLLYIHSQSHTQPSLSFLVPMGGRLHSLRVGWRNLVWVSLIFAIIVSFMLFTVFHLIYVLLYFEDFLIHDSSGFMILENLTESFGPVPFSAQYRICRPVRTDEQTDRRIDGRTDGQTDELIQVGPAGYEFTRSFGSCELSPS